MNRITKVEPAGGALRRWTGLLAVCLCVISCNPAEDPAAPEPTDRVLLVYFGGDNSLSGETWQKIEAIRAGLPPGNAKVLLYHDPKNATPVLTCLQHRQGQVSADTVAVYGEEDSATEAVFARVVDDVRAAYPARAYSLLVFSHASGWLPQGALNNPRQQSVVMDGSTEMDLAAFGRAIPDGAFDVIVFEACLMAGIEVAYELKDKTAYILASSAEIVSPGFTGIYPASLGLLLSGDPVAFGQAAFAYFDRQTGEMRAATFSVIRTAGLGALAAFVADNCQHNRPVDILALQHFDRKVSYRLFFDFEDYYARLLDTDGQRATLQSLINDCVVWKAATPSFLINYNGFHINRHSGLTVYIPQEDFPTLNNRYAATQWAQRQTGE
jgi:hypothetical protein